MSSNYKYHSSPSGIRYRVSIVSLFSGAFLSQSLHYAVLCYALHSAFCIMIEPSCIYLKWKWSWQYIVSDLWGQVNTWSERHIQYNVNFISNLFKYISYKTINNVCCKWFHNMENTWFSVSVLYSYHWYNIIIFKSVDACYVSDSLN